MARFAARFENMGFSVNPETLDLMKQMVAMGEVDALQPERIWKELHGALCESGTSRFIEELRRCGALEKILPEVDALFGIPQPLEYHPEVDTGVHVMMALDAAHRLSENPRVIFAVLVHDLGKALTPAKALPAHRGHEHSGLRLVEQLCTRLRIPGKYRRLALRVCEYHLHHHRMLVLKPTTVLTLLEQLEAFRQPDNVTTVQLVLHCRFAGSERHGRLGLSTVEIVRSLPYCRFVCKCRCNRWALQGRRENKKRAQAATGCCHRRDKKGTNVSMISLNCPGTSPTSQPHPSAAGIRDTGAISGLARQGAGIQIDNIIGFMHDGSCALLQTAV